MANPDGIINLNNEIDTVLLRMTNAPYYAMGRVATIYFITLASVVFALYKLFKAQSLKDVVLSFTILGGVAAANSYINLKERTQADRINNFRDYNNILNLIESATNVSNKDKGIYVMSLATLLINELSDLQATAPERLADPKLARLITDVQERISTLKNTYGLARIPLTIPLFNPLSSDLVEHFYNIVRAFNSQLAPPHANRRPA